MSSLGLDPFGFLLVHFIEDPNGDGEKIFFDISEGDDPTKWNPLNNGDPVLTSTLGTKGVRDPFIARNPETGKYYVLATDLRVFDGTKKKLSDIDWYRWTHSGSTNLVIWESTDLISWEGPRLLDMSSIKNKPALQLGMAWAPECIWVSDFYKDATGKGLGTFIVYWSSKILRDCSTEVNGWIADGNDGAERDCILWGTTSDFTQGDFEFGGVLIDTGGVTIDTTLTQHTEEDGTVKTYRISKDNSFGRGIWMESTEDEKWWLPSAKWRVIESRIGARYSDNNPGGVEGPAIVRRHRDQGWYLFVDVIPSIGYRLLKSNNLDSGWEYSNPSELVLQPHTKHGGVISLDRQSYNRLRNYYL